MPSLGDRTRAICEAVAHGLSRGFGIEARFRPRNDIEVGGRKLCGTGGFFDGDTLFYQGTVLIDVDPARMMACPNVPAAKLQKRDSTRPRRVTTLKALLGGTAPEIGAVQQAVLRGLAEKLGIEVESGTPTAAEEDLAKRIHAESIGTDDFVYEIDDPRGAGISEASLTGAGGTVSAFVRLEGAGGARRVREMLITGDFFVTPPRMVLDLEAALRGVPIAEVGAAVETFFAASRPDLLTIAPADFRKVIEEGGRGRRTRLSGRRLAAGGSMHRVRRWRWVAAAATATRLPVWLEPEPSGRAATAASEAAATAIAPTIPTGTHRLPRPPRRRGRRWRHSRSLRRRSVRPGRERSPNATRSE